MATLLTIARITVQNFLRSNGFDPSTYPAFALDTAIADAGEELARETSLLDIISTITLALNTAALPAVPTNFRPDRLKSAYLTGSNVTVDSYPTRYYDPDLVEGGAIVPLGLRRTATLTIKLFEQLNNTAIFFTSQTGQPTAIAFQKRDGTGICWPTPDDAYTCNLKWADLFCNFTPGTQGAWSSATQYYPGDVVSSGGNIYQALVANVNVAVGTAGTWLSLGAGTLTAPASVTMNIVDDYLRPILMYGAPSKLQFNEPGNSYAALAAKKWTEFIETMRNVGDLGEKVIQQSPADRLSGAYM